MRLHIVVKLRCNEPKIGNKLRALGNELSAGNTAKIEPQLFPMLNTIYDNPPKLKLLAGYNYRCNEFKYSKTYGMLTVRLTSETDTIKATDDSLRAIIKELMDLTGLTEFRGAKISSSTTAEELGKFKGLDSLPETTVTIGSYY